LLAPRASWFYYDDLRQRVFAHGVTQLILKRASASRSSGQWNDDDYDVPHLQGERGICVLGPPTSESAPKPDPFATTRRTRTHSGFGFI
jgi:hypothetical protein